MARRRSMILLGLGLAPAVSMAQVSANFGMVSDYIFRGVFQEDTSAFAGLDYENDSGFYIGTWGADVGDGLETDIYFGYGADIGDSGFGWSAGYTGYYYTDTFDDTYTEVNLGLSYGGFALDVAIGEWDGFGVPQDYRFTSIGYEFEGGAYVSYGSWGDQFDGDYFEVGYGFDFMGVDLSIAVLATSDPAATSTDPGAVINLSQDNSSAEAALVFGFSKAFDIGGD